MRTDVSCLYFRLLINQYESEMDIWIPLCWWIVTVCHDPRSRKPRFTSYVERRQWIFWIICSILLWKIWRKPSSHNRLSHPLLESFFFRHFYHCKYSTVSSVISRCPEVNIGRTNIVNPFQYYFEDLSLLLSSVPVVRFDSTISMYVSCFSWEERVSSYPLSIAIKTF